MRRTSAGRTGLRGYWQDALQMEPEHERQHRSSRRFIQHCSDAALFAALRLNLWCIERACPDLPAIWPDDTFPWIAEVQAAYPTIRREFEGYLAATNQPPPYVAEIAGMDLTTEQGVNVGLNDKGAWRSVVLCMHGHWVPETAEAFKETKALLQDLPDMHSIGFTCLDADSHIEDHVGPNKGALRYQLPILVPGELGECRIRIVDEMVPWVEGKSLVFDLAVNHEAWNDSDGFRVLLMLEVTMPLPLPVSILNRVVQRWFHNYPPHRGLVERMGALHRVRCATPTEPVTATP